MSVIKKTTTATYDISLDTMKEMIAADLGVPASEIQVEYLQQNNDDLDVYDRHHKPKGIIGVKVTHSKVVKTK